MAKNKASKNKTIDISLEEGKEYLERCMRLKKKATLDEVTDQLILGDTLRMLPKLPRESVDLLIVDPPYNRTKDYHGTSYHITTDAEYRAYTKKWIECLLPLLKPTASVYVCSDWQSSVVIGSLLYEYFHVRNRITWQREKGRGANANWKNGMEDIWFCTVSDTYTFHVEDVKQRRRVIAPYKQDGKPKDWSEEDGVKYRDTYPSNFWDDISIPYWSMKENTAHPTQKPEKLIAKLILASSEAGDIILDPFLGSGTTAVVAKKLGRRYIGIEQNELYCVWAQVRLEMAEKDRRIQGYEDGVFWERNTLAMQRKSKRNPEVKE